MAGRGILAEYRRRNILEDIYFRERRFSGEKERGDFYFDRGTPRWIFNWKQNVVERIPYGCIRGNVS